MSSTDESLESLDCDTILHSNSIVRYLLLDQESNNARSRVRPGPDDAFMLTCTRTLETFGVSF